MILGHGIDIVNLNRFDSMNEVRLTRLARRICTAHEFELFNSSKNKNRYLSKIWAGKEAIAKAFGTGIAKDITWKNIQIENNTLGKPSVWFKEKIAGPICHLSFSHDGGFLIASAILEMYV